MLCDIVIRLMLRCCRLLKTSRLSLIALGVCGSDNACFTAPALALPYARACRLLQQVNL